MVPRSIRKANDWEAVFTNPLQSVMGVNRLDVGYVASEPTVMAYEHN